MIRKKLTKFLCAILSMLIIFTFIGCGTQPSTKKEGKNENITLNFVHFFTKVNPDANSIAFYDSLKRFKKKYPNVTIKQESLDATTYETKIKTLAAGGDMPDLFMVKGSMVDNFANNNYIAPLNDILNTDKTWRDGFTKGSFDDFMKGNKIMGIPLQMYSTSLIFYNEKIFKKVGISSFPANWDEFIAAIKKLKANGYIPISMGNKGNWLAESCILSTLGDRFTGTDWFYSIRDHKGAKFTDPEFVKALTALQDLSKIGAFNSDMNSLDNMQQRTAYYQGKAAMFFEGAWAITQIANNAPKDILQATHIAILPSVKDGKGQPNTMSGGSGWAFQMNANLKGAKKAAAVALLKMLSDSEHFKVVIENNGTPAGDPGTYNKNKISSLQNEYLNLASKSKFVPIYDIQLSPSVIEVMCTGLQELLINKVTPKELAKEIQAEYTKS